MVGMNGSAAYADIDTGVAFGKGPFSQTRYRPS
jgi:hypothetical protein